KNGRRMKLRPLARSWTIVTMKLTEPSSDDVIRKTMPTSHIVWPPWLITERGGYEVQPDCAAPPGRKKLTSKTSLPTTGTAWIPQASPGDQPRMEPAAATTSSDTTAIAAVARNQRGRFGRRTGGVMRTTSPSS